VASSAFGVFFFAKVSFFLFGPLSGLGALIHALSGVAGSLVGLIVGAVVALIINTKIGKKWESDFGQSAGEQQAERVRLTCLGFLLFLVLLWLLIVAIARL
jgi:hypothetical protein